MKRLIFALLVLVLCAAFEFPPALPSSFWGYASGIPVGASVEISSGGVVLATAVTLDYQGASVYAVNVCNGNEGDLLQFRYRGALVGTGTYHVGTNQHVDLTYLVTGKIKRGK